MTSPKVNFCADDLPGKSCPSADLRRLVVEPAENQKMRQAASQKAFEPIRSLARYPRQQSPPCIFLEHLTIPAR
jgi:hypothetical protein